MPSRPTIPLDAELRALLVDEGVFNDYLNRPHYQRNDYLGWIGRAKQPETRQKRIDQMVDELRRGGVYMKMDHPASAKG